MTLTRFQWRLVVVWALGSCAALAVDCDLNPQPLPPYGNSSVPNGGAAAPTVGESDAALEDAMGGGAFNLGGGDSGSSRLSDAGAEPPLGFEGLDAASTADGGVDAESATDADADSSYAFPEGGE
jgi:hypothetical protein